jgi:hypothetical protein
MLTEEDIEAVLAPKVAGTWNLHDYSLDHPLDFFVVLSSVSGVLGNGGQSAYGAGNTFQDAFAHARRCAGLPALSIDLGPVEDTGAIQRIASRRQSLATKKAARLPSYAECNSVKLRVVTWNASWSRQFRSG